MAGENTQLFRVTNAGDNGNTVPANEQLLFNPDPSDVDPNELFCFNSEIFYRNSIPEVPKVQGQINEVQDMGLDGVDVMLTCRFQNSSNVTTDSPMDILKKWLIEDKANTDFPKGRFGLRIDDIPIFNVSPQGPPSSPEYGYILANARFLRPQDLKNMANVLITLRFSGDPTGLGT